MVGAEIQGEEIEGGRGGVSEKEREGGERGAEISRQEKEETE